MTITRTSSAFLKAVVPTVEFATAVASPITTNSEVSASPRAAKIAARRSAASGRVSLAKLFPSFVYNACQVQHARLSAHTRLGARKLAAHHPGPGGVAPAAAAASDICLCCC